MGMTYAKQMISGSFSADTALTSSNSTGFKQGNNLFLTLSWPGPEPCGTAGGGTTGFGAYQIGLSG